MPELPKDLLDLLSLAGKPGTRPLDRLKRGKPVEAGREAVGKLTAQVIGSLKDPKAFPYLQSALYLYFDCFDESHQISQEHEDLHGNWLHAIAHRREPDASNAKYWYRRTKIPLTVHAVLHKEVMDVVFAEVSPVLDPLVFKMLKSEIWEPEPFVDLCAQVMDQDPASSPYRALARMQEMEWGTLVKSILSKQP
jgi:hypothetical protein